MRNKIVTLLLILAIGINICGCGSLVDKMNRLSINMTKDEVRALFGTNFKAIASKVDSDGNVLDLWEFFDGKTKATYQIYFLNDKVSQWGKKEDLKAFPELHMPAYKPQ
ncbi:MAG: hypothetical protein HY810_07265 [Candidatus Omnitrophica bacterium]|nr:hypothetical protein [Candidatus Omnitrophota bacterium]